VFRIVCEVLDSPSRHLEWATRTFMELRLGRDFSTVRIDTDERAAVSKLSFVRLPLRGSPPRSNYDSGFPVGT
jgi:hypothetical protein